MARLSKHGNELLRIELVRDVTDPAEDITWSRVTRAYMSKGIILEKRDVRWKPGPYDTPSEIAAGGRLYSWGWKIHAKAKPGFTGQDLADRALAKIADKSRPASKWSVVSGGASEPAPFVLSQEQVLAAIARGEYTGICKACGEEVEGVEPDASGGECESCGQMEVYGAEECLMSLQA